jgi:cytidylate kinase
LSLLDLQPVVLVTGISGSGKSTVSELLARRFDRGVHVKGDVFRRMVVRGREEMSVAPSDEAQRQLLLRYQVGASTADAYHGAGFSVVVQDIIVGSALADYVGLINSRPLVVVVLAPDSTAIASREAARAKSAYPAEGPGVAEWDAVFRRETPKIGMWIDSSDQQPSDTVEAIIEQGLELGRVP